MCRLEVTDTKVIDGGCASLIHQNALKLCIQRLQNIPALAFPCLLGFGLLGCRLLSRSLLCIRVGIIVRFRTQTVLSRWWGLCQLGC
eukprot:2569920-Rhodomonas_salina.4